MTTRSKSRSTETTEFLEALSGGPLTFGRLLAAIRQGEEVSQVAFAATLGISKSHLCDIEKGRKVVGAARAARFASILEYSPEHFVALALQAQVEEAGLKLNVRVDAA